MTTDTTTKTETTTGITADFAVLAQDLMPALRAMRYHGKGKPITPDVHVAARESFLRLTATTTDASVSIRFPVDPANVRVPGECVAPFAALSDFARAGSTIRGIVNGDVALSNKGMHSEFPLRDVSQYPSLPQGDYPVARFDAGELRAALGKVMHAAAQDDTRPLLAGVHLKIEDRVCTVVACDGFRLVVTGVFAEYAEGSRGFGAIPSSLTVPNAGVRALYDALPDNDSPVVLMTHAEGAHATFAGKNWRCSTRLEQGRYINWEQVTPDVSTLPVHVMVDRLQLLKAAKDAVKATKSKDKNANEPSMSLTLTRDGTVAAWTSADGVSTERVIDGTVSVHYTISGSMEVAFNPSFVVDACQYGSGESLHVHLKDSKTAVLVNNSYVLMPMWMP